MWAGGGCGSGVVASRQLRGSAEQRWSADPQLWSLHLARGTGRVSRGCSSARLLAQSCWSCFAAALLICSCSTECSWAAAGSCRAAGLCCAGDRRGAAGLAAIARRLSFTRSRGDPCSSCGPTRSSAFVPQQLRVVCPPGSLLGPWSCLCALAGLRGAAGSAGSTERRPVGGAGRGLGPLARRGFLCLRPLHHKDSVLFSAFFHSGECIW